MLGVRSVDANVAIGVLALQRVEDAVWAGAGVTWFSAAVAPILCFQGVAHGVRELGDAVKFARDDANEWLLASTSASLLVVGELAIELSLSAF